MLSVFQSTHSFLIGRNRKGMRPRNQMLLLLLLWEPRERLIVGAFAATEPCSLHRSADAKRNGSLENRPETCGQKQRYEMKNMRTAKRKRRSFRADEERGSACFQRACKVAFAARGRKRLIRSREVVLKSFL